MNFEAELEGAVRQLLELIEGLEGLEQRAETHTKRDSDLDQLIRDFQGWKNAFDSRLRQLEDGDSPFGRRLEQLEQHVDEITTDVTAELLQRQNEKLKREVEILRSAMPYNILNGEKLKASLQGLQDSYSSTVMTSSCP